MLPITTILHPTDFSPRADYALRLACALARDYGARLILLHVRPAPALAVGEFGSVPLDEPEPAESVQARLRQLLPANLQGRAQYLVSDGSAAEAIVASVESTHCDLVVLGTHGRTGLGRLLLGSVAEAVLRKSPCPVLTVKQPLAPASETRPEALGAGSRGETGEELITVHTVANPIEADVVKNALKCEGIPCVLEGSQQAGVAGMFAFPIKIQVRPADVDRAARFIRSHESQPR
jgi:universal stress protein A